MFFSKKNKDHEQDFINQYLYGRKQYQRAGGLRQVRTHEGMVKGLRDVIEKTPDVGEYGIHIEAGEASPGSNNEINLPG